MLCASDPSYDMLTILDVYNIELGVVLPLELEVSSRMMRVFAWCSLAAEARRRHIIVQRAMAGVSFTDCHWSRLERRWAVLSSEP